MVQIEGSQYAHLCTNMSYMHHRRAGYPFGMLVDFAADGAGHPIFCLSPLSIHRNNLQEDPRCSLVVQMPGWLGLSDARVTIFGDVYELPDEMQVRPLPPCAGPPDVYEPYEPYDLLLLPVCRILWNCLSGGSSFDRCPAVIGRTAVPLMRLARVCECPVLRLSGAPACEPDMLRSEACSPQQCMEAGYCTHAASRRGYHCHPRTAACCSSGCVQLVRSAAPAVPLALPTVPRRRINKPFPTGSGPCIWCSAIQCSPPPPRACHRLTSMSV